MKCNKCGNEIKGNEKYCGNCGAKIDNQIVDKNVIKIKFSHLMIGIIVIIILFIILGVILYIKNSQDILKSAETVRNNYENNYSNSDNTSNTSKANSSVKVDITDTRTYINNNPIPVQKELDPCTIANDKNMNTYNTVDIVAVATAYDYAMKNINIQKVVYMMISHRDNYGRYRVIINYFTANSTYAKSDVVYFYYSKNSNNYKVFFEGNYSRVLSDEWDIPLDF